MSFEAFQRGFIKAAREAVIITGNPKYIDGNALAEKFYTHLEDFLKEKGLKVTRDPGEPYTQPKDADVWIGHSRGIDRLRFAGKKTTTIGLGSPYLKGTINHPKDNSEAGKEPNKFHYMLTDSMKKKILQRLV